MVTVVLLLVTETTVVESGLLRGIRKLREYRESQNQAWDSMVRRNTHPTQTLLLAATDFLLRNHHFRLLARVSQKCVTLLNLEYMATTFVRGLCSVHSIFPAQDRSEGQARKENGIGIE